VPYLWYTNAEILEIEGLEMLRDIGFCLLSHCRRDRGRIELVRDVQYVFSKDFCHSFKLHGAERPTK
jgi:hypothetical protein